VTPSASQPSSGPANPALLAGAVAAVVAALFLGFVAWRRAEARRRPGEPAALPQR
jgi:hypothetical protein